MCLGGSEITSSDFECLLDKSNSEDRINKEEVAIWTSLSNNMSSQRKRQT